MVSPKRRRKEEMQGWLNAYSKASEGLAVQSTRKWMQSPALHTLPHGAKFSSSHISTSTSFSSGTTPGSIVSVVHSHPFLPQPTHAMSSGLSSPTSVNIPSPDCTLCLADGSVFSGISFGTEGKSVAGACVFQTGEHLSQHGFTFPPFIPRSNFDLDLSHHRQLRRTSTTRRLG